MNVATALNKKYLFYTGVMLHSLCANNREPIRAFLLHSELDNSDIERLKKALTKFDIDIIPLYVSPSLYDARLPYNAQWSIETYYRLSLLELLPDNVDRLLYLDVDMIVNQSLDDVYYMDFSENEIISAPDSLNKRTWNNFTTKQREMFGSMLQSGYIYFNAGFMLLNIAEMRKKYSFETYLKAIEIWNYQMSAPDQDILNYVHWQNVSYVDPYKYDLFARIAHNEGITYEQAKHNAAVIHYAGSKPWTADNVHFSIEQIWWDYARQTPFYLELLENFLQQTMFSNSMEQYVKNLIETAENAKQQLEKHAILNQKLYSLVRDIQ